MTDKNNQVSLLAASVGLWRLRSFTISGSSMASSSSWAPAQCCDTKLTYSSSGHPDAFYLKVAETNTNITGQCPGSCVYVKYVSLTSPSRAWLRLNALQVLACFLASLLALLSALQSALLRFSQVLSLSSLRVLCCLPACFVACLLVCLLA